MLRSLTRLKGGNTLSGFRDIQRFTVMPEHHVAVAQSWTASLHACRRPLTTQTACSRESEADKSLEPLPDTSRNHETLRHSTSAVYSMALQLQVASRPSTALGAYTSLAHNAAVTVQHIKDGGTPNLHSSSSSHGHHSEGAVRWEGPSSTIYQGSAAAPACAEAVANQVQLSLPAGVLAGRESQAGTACAVGGIAPRCSSVSCDAFAVKGSPSLICSHVDQPGTVMGRQTNDGELSFLELHQPGSVPARGAANQPSSEPARGAANQPSSEPAREAANQPSFEPARGAANQPSSEAARGAANQPSSEPAREAAQRGDPGGKSEPDPPCRLLFSPAHSSLLGGPERGASAEAGRSPLVWNTDGMRVCAADHRPVPSSIEPEALSPLTTQFDSRAGLSALNHDDVVYLGADQPYSVATRSRDVDSTSPLSSDDSFHDRSLDGGSPSQQSEVAPQEPDWCESRVNWGDEANELGKYVRQKLWRAQSNENASKRELAKRGIAHAVMTQSGTFSVAEIGAVTGALRAAFVGDAAMADTLMLLSTLAALKLPEMTGAQAIGIASNLGFFAGAYIQKSIMRESVVCLSYPNRTNIEPENGGSNAKKLDK
jgi:hypothetical protein